MRKTFRIWGPRPEDDVDEELDFHVAMRKEEYLARGLSEDEAQGAIRNRLGDVRGIRADCIAIATRRNRRMKRTHMLDALRQDFTFGLRTMWQRKGWTAVAIVTLALGIGATTAVYSVVNSLLLHPLDYPNADRVAFVSLQPAKNSVDGISLYVLLTTPVLRAWQSAAHSFEDMEGYTDNKPQVVQWNDAVPQMLNVASVGSTLDHFTGMRPVLGRYFSAHDITSRSPVALLSEGLWRARFGGSTDVLGTSLHVGRLVYTVVGVMPAGFPNLDGTTTDLFLPLDTRDNVVGVRVIGRLRPGVSTAQAERELDSISTHIPGAESDPTFVAAVQSPSSLVRFRSSLILFAAAAGLVLIIACANVAHLLLARGASREREMAIRAAIGAGRWRLIRQMLVESLLLSAAGCAVGIGVGYLGMRAAIALRPPSLVQLAATHLSGSTLILGIGLAVVTGVLVALVAAWQAARLSSPEALRVGTPTGTSTSHTRVRALLVVTEMALSTVLVVGTALLVHSFAKLQFADPGFTPQGLYAFVPNLALTADTTQAQAWSFDERLLARIQTLPGVQGVTLATTAPPRRNFRIGSLRIEGQPAPRDTSTSFVNSLGVRPDFFTLMGMRFVSGATFTDTSTAAAQVIINESMARKYWPGGSAIGHRLRLAYGGQGDWMTIVGVVNDAATGGMLMQRTDPMLYTSPSIFFSPTILVRTDRPGVSLPAVRSVVKQMNAAIPQLDFTNIADAMSSTLAANRFTMLLLVVFTGVAVLLAAVGLYGVMAYAVAQRAREIGVRIALGATAGRVARQVIAQGLLLAVIGLAAGLLAAHWGVRLVSGMLSGVTASDPWSFIAAAVVLLGTAGLACAAPMLRAARVDPLVAMKSDG